MKREDKKVKGLYVTQTTASYNFSEDNIKLYESYIKALNEGGDTSSIDVSQVNNLEKILAICNETEINALVIDIKSDDGYITWSSDVEVVNNLETAIPARDDNFKALLEYMKAHDIYPIARIVAFKDYKLPELLPEHAMQLNEGGVYRDDQGMGWVNQYDPYIWSYVLAVSKEAALRGFKEIHFDYVRFPDNAAHYNEIVNFKGRDGKRKDDNIKDFLDYAKGELEPYGVNVGAAVFGIITRSWQDYPEDIGQTWIKISSKADLISPMIYPSHYSTGWYGYDYPDANPYGVFYHALREALLKNSALKSSAKIRPWIQGFTAPWVDGYIEYTPEVIAEQVKAGVELGIDEYLVWNAVNEYDPKTFIETTKFSQNKLLDPNNLPEYTQTNIDSERNNEKPSVLDKIGNSPYQVISDYFFNINGGYLDKVFLYTAKNRREETYEEFEKNFLAKGIVLKDWRVLGVEKVDGGYNFKVSLSDSEGEGSVFKESTIKVILEDSIFKVDSNSLEIGSSSNSSETDATSSENSASESTSN